MTAADADPALAGTPVAPYDTIDRLREENARMRKQLESIESYALAARADGGDGGWYAMAVGRIQVAASIGLRGHAEGPTPSESDPPGGG